MVLVFLSYALLASGIVTNKILLQIVPPTLLVGIRMLAAGMILLATYFRSHRLHWRYLKEDAYILTIITLFTTLIPALLKAFALKYLVASKAALIGSIDPFVTALYVWILWHEKLSLTKLVGILIGLSGVTFSIVATGSIKETMLGWAVFSLPEMAQIAAIFFGRYGWILVQDLLRKHRYMPAEINGITMLSSGLIALIYSVTTEPIALLAPCCPWKLAGLMAYTTIFGTVFGYTVYATMLKRHNATFMSLAGFSIPLFVSLLGWVFLNEKITLNFLIAAFLIFIGLIVFYWDELGKKKQII